MPFLIRTADGRTTICTACAASAAQHARRLQRSGSECTVSDVNGTRYELAGLMLAADGLRAQRAAILQPA